ncbi:hypothetical protein DPMN_129082 [Dreissena polymorpha]|uniref:Uncharacterized protein n=1 Tax=Dreissena polymorpha TaxID=45954 RepID=A0A9D4H203_DREPO|nr:hypothetical protein DPMN_129082 [Dreissena polymorpha]
MHDFFEAVQGEVLIVQVQFVHEQPHVVVGAPQVRHAQHADVALVLAPARLLKAPPHLIPGNETLTWKVFNFSCNVYASVI